MGHLVVDSGAERTTISNAAADRLGLPHDPRYTTRSLGIGGATITTDVTIDRLVLGGVHFPVDRIAVGTFKLQTERGLNADGLLGADILLAFDMDIDVPDGKLTLYRSRLCPNITPPWKEPAVEIAGVRARKDRLLLPFDLDNVPGLAILDTGAQANVIGVDMARRMGLTEQTLAADPAVRQHGVGPDVAISHLHQFKLLRIGPVAEESPAITVLPVGFRRRRRPDRRGIPAGPAGLDVVPQPPGLCLAPAGRAMIDKLEMLLALAREQHFGRAAEACGVTQPTLSAGLKQLEEGFGVLLVQRQSRFIGFTPEGLRVLDWSRRIVGDYRAMRDEIRALKRGLAGHLRIAAVPTALPIVSTLTTPLHAAHPEVLFTILSRNSIEILTLLENLEVDAGLTYVDNEPLGPGAGRPALPRALPPADRRRPAAGRPGVRHLGRGRQRAALPADPGHAEPPHHRPQAARRWGGACTDLAVQLHGSAVFPCPHRAVGQRDAGGAG